MTLDVTVDPAVGTLLSAVLRRKLRTEVARMVRAAARTDGRPDLEVALLLTTDVAIRELNRDFRRQDKPTDVLAFAQREGPMGATHPSLLGDIVISVETARRQARRGYYGELIMLASHGLCHLLGYDHRDDAETSTMNARMAALRREAKRRGHVRAA